MTNRKEPSVSLHKDTFLYLKPTDNQITGMDVVRHAFTNIADLLQHVLPDGADKTHVIRLLRTTAMWAHVAITREQDSSPRE